MQTCRTTRREYLPILTYRIHEVHIKFQDAPRFLQTMLQSKFRSVLIPTFREWVLVVDIGVWDPWGPKWATGIDVLPLLKQTAQAQEVQTRPRFGVRLHNFTARFFWQHLDALFRPDEATIPRRERLLAFVEALLVRKSSWKEYLVIVLKEGVGPIGTERARKDLVRAFGLKSESDRYVCLGYYGAGGEVEELVDVTIQPLGPLADSR